MPNPKTKKSKRSRTKQSNTLPFTKSNYRLFGLAVAVLVLGYFFLNQGPVNGLMSLSVAPVLLVIGYCILIPLAIIYMGGKKTKE